MSNMSNDNMNMDDMKAEIMEVIRKYTQVKDIQITSQNNQDIDVLEKQVKRYETSFKKNEKVFYYFKYPVFSIR